MKTIVAVDFDGTLCSNRFPDIGEPNQRLIDLLLTYRRDCTLILWTCRAGKALDDALWWCGERGLQFDYVNENTREVIDRFGGQDTRKLYADLYIDDRTLDRRDYGQIEDILD